MFYWFLCLYAPTEQQPNITGRGECYDKPTIGPDLLLAGEERQTLRRRRHEQDRNTSKRSINKAPIMEHVPHDVIVIESSNDEAASTAGRKRPSADSSTSTDTSVAKAKKRRLTESDDDEEAESRGQEASLPKPASSSPCRVPGIVMPLNPPSYSFESQTFLLPAFSDEMVGSRLQRFGRWIHALCLYNEGQGEATTSRVAVKAYVHYIRYHSDLGPAAKSKARKQANKAMQISVPLAKDLGMRLAVATAMPATASVIHAPVMHAAAAAAAAPVATHAAASASATVVVVADDASPAANESRDRDVDAGGKRAPRDELQRRYYPSATDPANMCLYCSRVGHVAADCPHKTCKFCGQTGHWHYACKTRQRCTNCRQLGHATSACGGVKVEDKTGLTCAFCDGKDHLEDECTEVWRTYHPPDESNKVKDMVISCAVCASREHYFSECPDRKYPANPTWTLANRARYVDANCGALSIAAAAEMRAGGYRHSVAKPGGKNQRQIRYSASEDSDIEMLGGSELKTGDTAVNREKKKKKKKKKKKNVAAATSHGLQRQKTRAMAKV
ncbi:hypothetical protein L249_5041 [Ophiocordyceps polyrhachis-furcata BCC 54312]|uniref:CCHC-type domain-containing protein n=1 Tax=Ophiocordyceps polyrhachis-furcata BCC 54312 TaxID=1330021 RepID=A0A367L3T7_9HYPO|nr:hypothetical protein L249_5041 [Ophiocordyceps polyrhachis-furcata BCC 54312]